MKIITSIILILVSFAVCAQDLSECGKDDNPLLNEHESTFLNDYINPGIGEKIDLADKKVIFVTGSSGQDVGTKSTYFDQIKAWAENGNTVATSIYALDNQQKKTSGGYDVIITYWVKVLSHKQIEKLVQKMGEGTI